MDTTLTNNQINIAVFSYRPEIVGSNVILFSISVTTRKNQTWIIEKRFSQFDALNEQLKQYFGDTLPSLPKKSYITLFFGKSHDDVEQRRYGLDYYLKNLIVRPEIFNSLPLRDFLELDKHFSEAVVNPPEMICEIKGFLHGVRDFVINAEQGVMFVINSDTNIFTRLDAYMTNMKMPWESETGSETVIPVSCTECWAQTETGEFERLWTKVYNSQAICLYWEPSCCRLIVGLDSGSLNMIKVPQLESNFRLYDESLEIEQHTDRVMGVFFDAEKQQIHSVSRDKRYRVLDLEKQILVADDEPGAFELTYILVSMERKKSFVGDSCGSIFIFDLTKYKPSAVIHVSSTSQSIRGMFIDSQRNFLFTVGYEEGEITVYDIGTPGKEQYTKEIAKMKNKMKSREICWSGSRGELYVGNDDGTVTVWDAKKTSPIFVIKAHTEDITKLKWLEVDQTLLTSGKDKLIKAWRMPSSWRDKIIVEQEEKENNILLKTQSMLRLQQKTKQKDLDSDEEDELSTWQQ